MRRAVPTLVVLGIVLALVAWAPASLAKPVAQESRNMTVLVGGGQDTMDLQGFFPQTVRIRAGDTITWTQNSDAPHTVSFLGSFPGPSNPSIFGPPGVNTIPSTNIPAPGLVGVNMLNPLEVWPYPGPELSGTTYRPGEFVGSGHFRATPQTPGVDEITTFSLAFDAPGTYRYVCLTHRGTMLGIVEVATVWATGVPSQADIDAQAQTEIDGLVALAERQMPQRTTLRSEPGANGSSIWFVSAGPNFFRINDERAQLDEFMPRDLTITSGDTVVWGSTGFHAVTFNPSPIIPQLNRFETLPDGSRAVINNPEVFDGAKPTGVFDPTQYYVSGNLFRGQPSGVSWALTFETPGTFEYYCAVHRERGMVGSITVVAGS